MYIWQMCIDNLNSTCGIKVTRIQYIYILSIYVCTSPHAINMCDIIIVL